MKTAVCPWAGRAAAQEASAEQLHFSMPTLQKQARQSSVSGMARMRQLCGV